MNTKGLAQGEAYPKSRPALGDRSLSYRVGFRYVVHRYLILP